MLWENRKNSNTGRSKFHPKLGLTFGEKRDKVKNSRAKVKEIWIPD
jgi:hypothetical protein